MNVSIGFQSSPDLFQLFQTAACPADPCPIHNLIQPTADLVPRLSWLWQKTENSNRNNWNPKGWAAASDWNMPPLERHSSQDTNTSATATRDTTKEQNN